MLTILLAFLVGLVIGHSLGWASMHAYLQKRSGLGYHEIIAALAMIKMDDELLRAVKEVAAQTVAQMKERRGR